jgi:hypothetical protein
MAEFGGIIVAEFGGIILSGRALVAILKVLVHREKQKEDVTIWIQNP